MIKDKGLRIRVEQSLREEFLDVCRAQDRSASQVLREYMRDYVARHRAESQLPLFPADMMKGGGIGRK